MEIDEFLVLKFADEKVNTMCRINKVYEKYVVTKEKRNILYLILNRALHRSTQSALLWYRYLVNILVYMEFEINLCHLCIANSNIENK